MEQLRLAKGDSYLGSSSMAASGLVAAHYGKTMAGKRFALTAAGSPQWNGFVGFAAAPGARTLGMAGTRSMRAERNSLPVEMCSRKGRFEYFVINGEYFISRRYD